ncbi:hypothetical protein [Noviherbaspirillum sp. ST9]|uniref:hypothetical protein n=1 Tax=Noviherbaspirillum sp. ST9 TaxID=3401606 RepID=UPI003B5866A0
MTIPSYAKLQRYWDGWDSRLKQLISGRNGARLFFPTALQHGEIVDGKITIRPVAPIFIHNAPPKASSSRGKSTRLAIFIAGSFEVSAADEQPCMHKADCNVTFYTCKPEPEGFSLKFFDAMHFDFEAAQSQTAFHPIFHVQRGVSREVSDDTVRDLFQEHLHTSRDKVVINNEQVQDLGTPYLRLPTPQLDMFSVMTLIMADFFCNGGDISQDKQLVPRFRAILDYLRHEANIIREGHGSRTLKGRIEAERAQHMSAAHWYAECT